MSNINEGQIKINSETLMNTCLKYMIKVGQAWNNMDRAFIHLCIFFMKNDDKWYNENDISNRVKTFIRKPELSVQMIKMHLDILANTGVLYKKDVKGKHKYKITNMGIGMIMNNSTFTDFFKLFTEQKTDNKIDNKETPPALIPTVFDVPPQPDTKQ